MADTDQVSGSTPKMPVGPAERVLTMEAPSMNDQVVCVITTADIVPVPPRIVPKPAGLALGPDLRQALKDSFRQNEAAYRYLGR